MSQLTTTQPLAVRFRVPLWVSVAAVALTFGGATALFFAISGDEEATQAPSIAGSASKESRYVQAISSLTPKQIAAAFGTEATVPQLSPNEKRYVGALASLTPQQIAAAFGTEGIASGEERVDAGTACRAARHRAETPSCWAPR